MYTSYKKAFIITSFTSNCMYIIFILLIASAVVAIPIYTYGGVAISLANKTLLKHAVDYVLEIQINNTQLSQRFQQDVFTLAVINYAFHCGARGNHTSYHIVTNPVDKIFLSFHEAAPQICTGEITRFENISLSLIYVERSQGRPLGWDFINISKLLANRGIYIEILPEYRIIDYKVRQEVVDPCSWVQYVLEYPYGGVVGVIKIVSYGCFNKSRALRVSYQPTYHFLSKYLNVTLSILINNTWVVKDLTGGGEVVLPDYGGIYGEVKNFTIELKAVSKRNTLTPLNLTGPITLRPLEKYSEYITGNVYQITTDRLYQAKILLNTTLSTDGLYINYTPAPHSAPCLIYGELEQPNVLVVNFIPQTGGIVQGNLTIYYYKAGVEKFGIISIPPISAAPRPVERSVVGITPIFYPVATEQPQPIIQLKVPRVEGAYFLYTEVNMTINPRDPYLPVKIFPVVFLNKSGALVPISPGRILLNSTNSGNALLRNVTEIDVKFTMPIPDPNFNEIILYIYGENIQNYSIVGGRTYYLAQPTSLEVSYPLTIAGVSPPIVAVFISLVLIGVSYSEELKEVLKTAVRQWRGI